MQAKAVFVLSLTAFFFFGIYYLYTHILHVNKIALDHIDRHTIKHHIDHGDL